MVRNDHSWGVFKTEGIWTILKIYAEVVVVDGRDDKISFGRCPITNHETVPSGDFN